MGQVYRNNASGENYLVTRLYQEVFSTYAILRKIGDEAGGTVRVKVEKNAEGVGLAGYTFTQEQLQEDSSSA
jgi:hypothetical protein